MGSGRSPLGQEESMVERVAVAIHAVLVRNRCDDTVCKFVNGCGCAQDAARAAIEAMRHPTKAMIEASNREWDGRMSHRSSGAWQAMIDAALTKPSAAAP